MSNATGNVEDPNSKSSPPHFESALERLQLAVKRLESGELSLEDSLRQFEEGVRLTRLCQEYLNSAEQRVEVLMKTTGDGSPNLQPFSNGQTL